MADYLSVIKPIPNNTTAGASYYVNTNYVLNSSFELWTGAIPNNWTAFGVPTIGANHVYTWRGTSSVALSAADSNRGIYQDIAGTNGQSYRLSLYICLVSGSIILSAEDFGGGNAVVITSTTAGWQRLSVTKVAAAGGVRFAFGSNNTACACYFDCAQMEDGIQTTTYIDGDQPGCWFNGTWQASTSTRSDQSREGGAIVGFNTIAKTILGISGASMPPFKNVSMPFGLVGGSMHQRTVKQARGFTVTLLLTGTTIDSLHTKFHLLQDLLKHDLVTPEQSLKLLYNDMVSATTLTIHAVYDAGLEGAPFSGPPSGKFMTVGLRFIADDPCWYDDRQMVQILGTGASTFYQAVVNANCILQRGGFGNNAGIWSSMSTGMDFAVRALAYAPDGSLYAGGNFTTAGGTTVNGIAKWTGAWSAMGVTGLSGPADAYAIAIGPDGKVYVGGNFTLAGGVANTLNIAYWDGTWHALGTGCNGVVWGLAFGKDGYLYATGLFTLAGGIADTVYVAKWSVASGWLPLGTGLSAQGFCVTCGPDNLMYFGGEFATANGVTVNRLAKWTGATFVGLGGTTKGVAGSGNQVYALVFGLDGKLYVGGDFTSAGGVTIADLACWNGAAFTSLGIGVNNDVFCLGLDQNGKLYIGGSFTTAGGLPVTAGLVTWTGSAFMPPDITLPAASIARVLTFDPRGNLYLGFDQTGTAYSATVTISANASTKTYPLFYMTGPGTLYQIMNYTTGRAIYFNNLTLQAGEICLLQLMPGQVNFISSWRGSLNNYILQGSNMDWYLQPGNNNVSGYLTGGAGTTAVWMCWNNTFWSADGVA